MHPRDPGHVTDDVVELHVHLHQRLLHVLDRRRGGLDQPLAVPHEGSQRRDLLTGPEASAEQAVLMEPLDPLRIGDIRLPAGNVLDVPRVDEQHLEPARLEDLERRDPVDARGFHRHRRDPRLREPIGHAVQVAGEALEAPHWLRINVTAHRDHVKRGPNIDPRGMTMHDGQGVALCAPGLLRGSHRSLLSRWRPRRRDGGSVTFLNGIAEASPLSSPQQSLDHVF